MSTTVQVLQPSLSVLADRLDVLSGCSGRSISSLEAAWNDPGWTPNTSWREAYTTARERARLVSADQDQGLVLAFLEGMLLGTQVEHADSDFTAN